MNKFFNMDNPMWHFFTKLANLVILNLCFLICCIPLVTIGASVTALYHVSLRLTTNDETPILQVFFSSFKQNFRQASVMWLIDVIIATLIGLNLILVNGFQNSLRSILHIFFLVLGLITYLVILYTFPLLCKFENTILCTFKNAFFMSIRHFPTTIVTAFLTLTPFIIFFMNTSTIAILIIIYLIIGFGLTAFCSAFLFGRIFKKYMPKES